MTAPFGRGTRIAGTGRALPAGTLTNAELEKIVDTSDEWIVQRTGIRVRHRAAENEAARFDPRHLLDLGAGERLDELIDRAPKRLGVPQERGDVAEKDARFGIIGNGADGVGEAHGATLPRARANGKRGEFDNWNP